MHSLRECLSHSVRLRCPRCGKAPVFSSWGKLHIKCPGCGLAMAGYEPHTWFFMYMSTAAITGLFVIAMCLITPTHQLGGKLVVAVTAALFFFGTQPLRKSLAIGFEFWLETRMR